MLLRLFSLGLILGLVALMVIFNKEIVDFSTTYLTHQKAAHARQSGSADAVVAVYEKALTEHPANVRLALELAKLYIRQGQGEGAEKIYQDILAQRPDEVQTRIAYAAWLAKDPATFNEAISHYRKALDEDPANKQLLNRLGRLYRRAAANPEEPREDVKDWLLDWSAYYYRLSLKLDPAYYGSRFGLGVAYQMRGKPEPAAKQYCNAVIIRPDAYEARFNLGLALVELKYADAGFRQMNQAVKMLSDQGPVTSAQALAEQLYAVKSGIYYDTDYAGLKNDDIPAFLNPACFEAPVSDEQAGPEEEPA